MVTLPAVSGRGKVPGEVFAPFHGYLPILADELERALRDHQFEAVIGVEGRTPVHAWLPIEQHYRPAGPVVNHRSMFWRPELRYVPR